jgi:KaiC/GvpD/RAD55 family RecA-like ATPase
MAQSETLNKIPTGIPGLDELLSGGVPEGSQMLLVGEPGVGKTLLSFEVAYNSAKEGRPSLFMTMDQSKNSLLKNINSAFPGFDGMKDLIDKNSFNVAERAMDMEFKSRENLVIFVAEIMRLIKSNNAKLLVMDSISLLRSLVDDDRTYTRALNFLVETFRNLGVTSIINIESRNPTKTDLPGLYEESMFDGIVLLTKYRKSEESQFLNASISKLRYSKYRNSPITLEITPNGIMLKKSN